MKKTMRMLLAMLLALLLTGACLAEANLAQDVEVLQEEAEAAAVEAIEGDALEAALDGGIAVEGAITLDDALDLPEEAIEDETEAIAAPEADADLEPAGDAARAVTGVTLNKKRATVYKGNKLKLKATVEGGSSKLTWTSSKKSVARVSSKGVVTALKAGKTTITVKTKNGKKATCKITVKNKVKGNLQKYIDKPISTVKAQLYNKPSKRGTRDDGIPYFYDKNYYCAFYVDDDNEVIEIRLIKASSRYKLYNIYPGMKSSTAKSKLKKAGWVMADSDSAQAYFVNDWNTNVMYLKLGSGKVQYVSCFDYDAYYD